MMRDPYSRSPHEGMMLLMAMMGLAGVPMEVPYSYPEALRHDPEPDTFAQLRAAETALANARTPGGRRKAQRRVDALTAILDRETAPNRLTLTPEQNER